MRYYLVAAVPATQLGFGRGLYGGANGALVSVILSSGLRLYRGGVLTTTATEPVTGLESTIPLGEPEMSLGTYRC